MKNNKHNPTRQDAEQRGYTAYTDILVHPQVVQMNQEKLQKNPPKRKRRINYAKKILRDPLVFNA
jgi:hypothetical protein